MRLTLLWRFAITSLVIVTLVGGVLSLVASHGIRDRELRAADLAAELLVDLGVLPLLDTRDFAPGGGGSPELVRAALQEAVSGRGVVVTLVDGEGAPGVATTDPAPSLPPSLTAAGLERPSRAVGADAAGREWLHVAVPARFGEGPVVGSVVVTRPYDPVAALIRSGVTREVAVLVGGLALLFALLHRSVRGASRELERHAAERDHAATHDPLTGLPNRHFLNAHLDEWLGRGLQQGRTTALLLLDLDRFKMVNDTLGHQAGDMLLRQVGQRFAPVIHPTDLLVRLGGDEFAVLLPDVATPGDAEAVARRLVRTLDEPFTVAEVGVSIGASVGVACTPQDASDRTELLKRADAAMYVAKRSGVEVARFEPAAEEQAVANLALLGQLRHAIDADELELHYQPQVDLRSGACHTVEALVRWDHPQLGMLPPPTFVELAEQSGLIGPLTRWVLTTALMQVAQWRDAGIDVAVAVNLSARDVTDPDLPGWVAGALERWRVPPERLELELTEGSLLADPAAATRSLGRLRRLGVRIAVDDFGTGYSSLAYLGQLPLDVLKIDRSFVAGFGSGATGDLVVRSVNDLAHGLGLVVVAEGVEEEDVAVALQGLGVETGQGWLWGRPAPAAELEAFLRRRADRRVTS